MIVKLIEQVYSFLWGDLLQIPLPGGGSVGISLLIILLIPAGIYFTIRTRVLPIRLFPDMVTVLTGKKEDKNSLSTFSDIDRIRQQPVSEWEIWSALLRQYPQVVRELYSGCG